MPVLKKALFPMWWLRPWSRPQVSSFSASHHNSSNERQSSQTSYQYSQTPDSLLSSQASSCSSSCWDSSLQRQTCQTEAYYQRSQTYSHRKCSEPPACQSSQVPSFSQHEIPETAASFCQRDRYTLSTQTPERPSEHQVTPWRNSTKEIRPSFILNRLPDEEDPDEMLLPTSEQPNSHKEEHPACHQVSSYLRICEETGNISSTQREMVTTESWNIAKKELEDADASGSRLQWKKPLFDPTEDTTRGGEDGDMLCMLSESDTIKTGKENLPSSDFVTGQGRSCDAHSHNLMRNIVGEKAIKLTVDLEHMTEAGIHEDEVMTGRGHKDTALLNTKELANETGRIWIWGTKMISTLEGNLGLSATDCDTSVEMLGMQEGNFEYRPGTSDFKEVQRSPAAKNGDTAVGHHTGSPEEIPLSLESRHHTSSDCLTKTLQDMGQTVTETAERDHAEPGPLVQSDPTNLVLSANSAANLERIDVTEVRLEGETESSTKANTGHGMETGQAHCSDIQLRKRQCETNYREAIELPRIDTESGDRREDREELVLSPVDCEDKSKYRDR
ncbi:uncharacterized protein LOC127532282 [Acanthochromis polyacanthus]|uniref:uncharacterized protein LOC127532282 n=1 Tax=Acanthochromis polyacanthus TaxID=80966 RepID=UPI002234CC5F|nr:uncharacterized protein LOC127532282 [Acanthochromis polyacanthus]